MNTLRNLLRIPVARVALAILFVVAVVAVFGATLSPHDPLEQDPAILQGPNAQHWLGTDYVGRDVLSRLMAGTRLSIIGALEAVAVGLVIGVPTGLLSVWMGRFGEWVSLRVSETLMILPFTVFAIAVAGTLGNGLHQAMIAVGVLMSPGFFRITRAVALGLRTTQYVEAAELMGAALLVVASLAFLGLGIIPPTPTWGGMLSADLGFLEQQPWAPIFPGVLLVLTVGSLNILADCIREASAGEARRRRGVLRRAAGRRDQTPIGLPVEPEDVITTEEEPRRVVAA